MNTLEKAIKEETRSWLPAERKQGDLDKVKTLPELEQRFPATDEWMSPYAAREYRCDPGQSAVGITIYSQKLKSPVLFELKHVAFECGHCKGINGIIIGMPIFEMSTEDKGKCYLDARCPDMFCGSLLYRKEIPKALPEDLSK